MTVMKELKGQYKVVACADKNNMKAKFIEKVVHDHTGNACCVFGDVAPMKSSSARCSVHKDDECDIPSSRLAVGGFSCKDLSQANKKQKGHAELFTRGDRNQYLLIPCIACVLRCAHWHSSIYRRERWRPLQIDQRR